MKTWPRTPLTMDCLLLERYVICRSNSVSLTLYSLNYAGFNKMQFIFNVMTNATVLVRK